MTESTKEAGRTPFRLLRYLSDVPDWETYGEDDELFIQGIPKVELHVHLDGSFDPDFLWDYLQTNSDLFACLPVETKLPWEPDKVLKVREMVQECKTSRDFHGLCTCRGYRSLKAMLNCFEIFLPLVRNQYDLLEELAFDFCKRQWEQNIVYTEVRYSPFLLAEPVQKDSSFQNAGEKALAVFEAVVSVPSWMLMLCILMSAVGEGVSRPQHTFFTDERIASRLRQVRHYCQPNHVGDRLASRLGVKDSRRCHSASRGFPLRHGWH